MYFFVKRSPIQVLSQNFVKVKDIKFHKFSIFRIVVVIKLIKYAIVKTKISIFQGYKIVVSAFLGGGGSPIFFCKISIFSRLALSIYKCAVVTKTHNQQVLSAILFWQLIRRYFASAFSATDYIIAIFN